MAPKKRAADTDPSPPTKVNKAEGTNQVASAVPRPKVDEFFPGVAGAQVYQEANINWGVKLNQTDLKSNANKFYVIQLVEKGGTFTTYTRWGRVGERGQDAAASSSSLDEAKKVFCEKFKDKTKNDWKIIQHDSTKFVPAAGKYTLVDVVIEDDAPAAAQPTGNVTASAAVKCQLDAEVQSVLNTIFDKDMFKNQLLEQQIDANKMPLGKLSKAQLEKGFHALEAIEKAIKAGQTSSLEDLTSAFYSIIPHTFGRNKPTCINTPERLAQKFDLLNVLGDIQVAVEMDAAAEDSSTVLHPLDKQYKELDCGLNYVDPTSEEFALIKRYTEGTQGHRKCSVVAAYRVDRPSDKARMQQFASLKERKLLWHGTNIAVIAAILKTGLRIMPHAGGRVGRGLYFASENGKSAGYVCCDKNTGFMFLVEVALGNSREINQDDSSLTAAKVAGFGVDSIIARGRQEPDPTKDVTIKGEWGDIKVPVGKPIPQSKWSNSTFSQSEYLVYDEGQVRIKYLLKMHFPH